ncbi:MAG TPA: PHP domain-containing protein, partial [Solirubrobacteraceae bacterium]|nr:PHP domain-containing protein [Solirubrobacteraceae bacterium]
LSQTGSIPSAERLRAKFPPGVIAITRLPGIGPKRARLLHSELGIDSLEALRQAAEGERLRTVRGLGPRFEERVLGALQELPPDGGERRGGSAGRIILPRAIEIGEAIAAGLMRVGPSGTQVELAGSARRAADSVKDLDLIATAARPTELLDALAALPEIERISSTGAAGARARTHSGIAVDLRISTPQRRGNLLQHFTGSSAHNAALREGAARRGLHVSEHGILDDATGETLTCATEEAVYERLGLAFIEPELREDRGELEAARLEEGEGAGARGAHGGLPQLITVEDVRGDLHSHTIASDGRNTIGEMARAARARGYEYLAVTDHSASHGFGNAVSPQQLVRQIELIREANEEIEGIELLAGTEVNVLPDGSLDYDDDLLALLDWVVASIHTAFGMDEREMTERMITAIEHPLVDAIGHPTGRLIERRAPYALDLEAVFAAAADSGTMLEINANPDRRDLCDLHARAAARAGVMIVIDSDAHRTETLANMRWGIATARRAWLTRQDVANTRGLPALLRLGKRGRRAPAAGQAGRG